MSIDPGVRLPVDSVASVASEGLLGGKHIRIEPGKSQETLAAGAPSTIPATTSPWKRWWARSSSPPPAARGSEGVWTAFRLASPSPACGSSPDTRPCTRRRSRRGRGNVFRGRRAARARQGGRARDDHRGARRHAGSLRTLEIVARTCRKRPPEEPPRAPPTSRFSRRGRARSRKPVSAAGCSRPVPRWRPWSTRSTTSGCWTAEALPHRGDRRPPCAPSYRFPKAISSGTSSSRRKVARRSMAVASRRRYSWRGISTAPKRCRWSVTNWVSSRQ